MPATIDHIEAFFSGQKQVLTHLQEIGEISLVNELENVLAKSLVIACASYFEDFITAALLSYVAINSKSRGLSEFCKKISQRQYHSWFEWDRQNANRFIVLFGEDAKELATKRSIADADFEPAVRNFMFLGSQRNLIVHRNMLAYSFTDTSDEVMAKARRALLFVNFVADDLFELK